MRADLLAALWCPADHGDLRDDGDAATCVTCARRYPVIDGVLSFLADVELVGADRAEQQARDDEASWYDTLWPEYADRIECPAHAEQMGAPSGPVLDIGCGPGRITGHLAGTLGLPTIALDYSLESLRLLAPRCAGLPVLPVHADARALPLRDGAVDGATSGMCYEHLRADDRLRMLHETARVLRPGCSFGVTTLNYNLLFRLWKLKGNAHAKEGEHLFGQNFYYVRQTASEFRAELERVFTVERVMGIRSFPVRSVAGLLGKVAGQRTAERFMGFMTRTGYRADRALERTPVGRWLGFLLLARATVPAGTRPTGTVPTGTAPAA
jgi:ubiquinone/menaquinone biosynthesis C-methylase UbiE/uncharacterized protein YbaR (Trm112 family)